MTAYYETPSPEWRSWAWDFWLRISCTPSKTSGTTSTLLDWGRQLRSF